MDKEKAKNRGDLIKKIRLSKGWKQADLASATGISRVTIGNYERGEREPNIENNIKIAEALNIDLGILLFVDEGIGVLLPTPEEEDIALTEFAKKIEKDVCKINPEYDTVVTKQFIALIYNVLCITGWEDTPFSDFLKEKSTEDLITTIKIMHAAITDQKIKIVFNDILNLSKGEMLELKK